MGPSKEKREETLDQQRQHRARLAKELEEVQRRAEKAAEKAKEKGEGK